MIPEIRNTFMRRLTLVLTVGAVVVCLGPVHLIVATLRWVEKEYDVDLRASWAAIPKEETK